MKAYLLAILIALDQLANAVLGGSPDETLSARAWRMEQKGRPAGRYLRPFIDALFWPIGQANHCQDAYISELNRRQYPAAYTLEP